MQTERASYVPSMDKRIITGPPPILPEELHAAQVLTEDMSVDPRLAVLNLRRLVDLCVAPTGSPVLPKDRNQKPFDPLARMGWAEIVPAADNTAYRVVVNDEGRTAAETYLSRTGQDDLRTLAQSRMPGNRGDAVL